MNKFVVFYAWQSDRVQRFNKYLIRIALDQAAKKISNDATVAVRVKIDADTEGVVGHVPVTDTILKKIAACNAFVPDRTSRLSPQPTQGSWCATQTSCSNMGTRYEPNRIQG